MRSIHHHNPPLPSLSDNFHRFSTHAPPPTTGLKTYFSKHVRTKPMAVINSHLVVLAVDQPVATEAAGNISVLIPTSIAFIFLYWIANFVVPEIIMKDLTSDDSNNDQNPN